MKSLCLIAMLAGCSSHPGLKTAGKAVVDCTTATAEKHYTELGPVFRELVAASIGAGHVDWSVVEQYIPGMTAEVSGCLIARALTDVLDLQPKMLAAEGPLPFEEDFRKLADAKFGGAVFHMDHGTM